MQVYISCVMNEQYDFRCYTWGVKCLVFSLVLNRGMVEGMVVSGTESGKCFVSWNWDRCCHEDLY